MTPLNIQYLLNMKMKANVVSANLYIVVSCIFLDFRISLVCMLGFDNSVRPTHSTPMAPPLS